MTAMLDEVPETRSDLSTRQGGASLRRRKLLDRSIWIGCSLALLLVVVPVVSIVGGVVGQSVSHWQWGILDTLTSGTGGGLSNAIVGTMVIMFGVALLAGLVGVAGGVYLAEFCPEGSGGVLRGASEVLSGVPSIVLGYVGYVALVVFLHWGFSLAAALIVMSILVLPYIIKATESSVRQVPTSYREGGEALGMRTGYALRRLVLRPAIPGITTGLIVALAVAVGETAPLLYTAEWSSQMPTGHLTHSPVGYLTYPVWEFFNQPYASAHRLAETAAFLLVLLVLLLIIVARLVVALTQRHAPEQRGAAKTHA